MKLYFPAITLHKINIKNLQSYLVKEQSRHLLFSDEGIIQVQGEKLIRIAPLDVPLLKEKINEYDILIDNSQMKKEEEEWYQIYPNALEEITQLSIFQLRKGAEVECIIESQKNKITDFYFLIKKDVHPHEVVKNIHIKEDILTFLFELNLC
jgi:hypothetical protein